MENWFVVVMGLCTVFVVLTLIILLCMLLAKICQVGGKKEDDAPAAVAAVPASTIPNRAEFVAAVSAAIAEASGTDASAIRILSVKKI